MNQVLLFALVTPAFSAQAILLADRGLLQSNLNHRLGSERITEYDARARLLGNPSMDDNSRSKAADMDVHALGHRSQ